MKVPGFSKITERNKEAWYTLDLSTATSNADKNDRPCIMPMRSHDDPHLLSGVVYLDYDAKEWPEGWDQKKVVKTLRKHPLVQWAGKSSGTGALAYAVSPELVGRAIENADAEYHQTWDSVTADIESDTGLKADRSARGVNRVVFLPQSKCDWEPPVSMSVSICPSDGPRKGRLGRGAPPPSEVDSAVAEDLSLIHISEPTRPY